VSYLRSVHLHKDKSIFKLEELPTERFAESLGLPGAPKIKFLSRGVAKAKKNASRTVEAAQRDAREDREEEEDSDDDDEQSDEEAGSVASGGENESDDSDAEDGEDAKAEDSTSKPTKVCLVSFEP
jgi:ATP-dependent RNA helicase DDX10/DBP4